jgi:hypothetical protein
LYHLMNALVMDRNILLVIEIFTVKLKNEKVLYYISINQFQYELGLIIA